MPELSLLRINLLRAAYLILAAGLGLTLWPSILNPAQSWDLMHGVVISMLAAISLLAILGLRYPLQMLPLLFFEIAWKAIWLFRIALPLWSANTLDAQTTQTAFECLAVIIILALIPWAYVFKNYVQKPGDPWRKPL